MTELQSPPEELESKRHAVLFQQEKVRAGAATGIQQSRPGKSGCGFLDEWRDETSEAAKPEVTLLSLKRVLEESVHRGRISNRASRFCARSHNASA